MKIVKGVAAMYRHITGDYWKAFWIEHGKPKCKYIESKADPANLTFAQIKRKKDFPEKYILRLIGAPIMEEKN